MKSSTTFHSVSVCVALFGLLSTAQAAPDILPTLPGKPQLVIEIKGVGANQIPVAIATFANEEVAPEHVSAIVQADLARSGQFKIVANGATLSETSPINFNEWKSRGANALAVGSVQRLADGRFDVRYRLYDVVRGTEMGNFSMAVPGERTRLSAHRIADDVYQKLTGTPGIFSTRIAYVAKQGREYRLEVADADGEGVQAALRSTEPIISPTWSPDGSKLAYVSFENHKPVVFVQDLATRQRTLVANYKGNNSAPAWAPDMRRMAVALSRDGYTQIYSINADGSGSAQRLTTTSSIETEPRYSPDGASIYFTSDRGGGPQIYRMGSDGSGQTRIAQNGGYNISPRISPDGKQLAFVSRRDGVFQVYVMNLDSSSGVQELRLSEGNLDESPSFAPNGRFVMYASGGGRRGTLGVSSVDGQIKYELTPQGGEIREPAWGPFTK